MSIISLADLELRLGKTITGTDSESLYTSLISVVQDKVENICNRKFEEAEYTEKYNGSGDYDLLLNNYPIISITSIQNIDVDGDIIETFDSTDYVINNKEGSVYYSGSFPSGRYNIKVVYTAGYSENPSSNEYAVPNDLKECLISIIEETKNKSFTDGSLQSETLGSYSYTKKSGSGIGVVVNSDNLLVLKNYMKFD